MEKLNSKTIITVIALIIVAVLSIFVIAPFASSAKTHANSIKTLDEKKITVMELTAATAGSATALAAIPGDFTTPVSNQILQLSSYLLIVIGAIFLEKVLLTLTGLVAFKFLIPIACLLYAVYVFVEKDFLRNLALKLIAFGIVITLIVPVSVSVSNLIEKTHKDSITQTVEDAKNAQNEVNQTEVEESQGDNGNIWDTVTSKVKEGISNIGEGASKVIKKGEELLNKFIDAIAILLITSCVIPIVVLFAFIWLVKIIFSVNVPLPKFNKNVLKKEEKNGTNKEIT